ncbi:hypothetical protein [Actinoplanes sp. NPDC051851]|uniref:hypothetical protein n=1 Tax=Actinoplanes sp. NPDC051851 TaxID=3154753 RepID=UPI003443F40B
MGVTRRIAAVVVASGVLVGGFAAPAMANSSTSCTALPYVVIGNRTCKTGILYSNAAHDLRIIARSDVFGCTESPWSVWDVDTGRTVASGKSVPKNVVIHGLYGRYRGRLNQACYKDTLQLRDY